MSPSDSNDSNGAPEWETNINQLTQMTNLFMTHLKQMTHLAQIAWVRLGHILQTTHLNQPDTPHTDSLKQITDLSQMTNLAQMARLILRAYPFQMNQITYDPTNSDDSPDYDDFLPRLATELLKYIQTGVHHCFHAVLYSDILL